MSECHQYSIRQERAALEQTTHGHLVGTVSLRNSVVRAISRQQAQEVILTYEWLKSMPSYPIHYFGLFFYDSEGKEHLGGVLVYSHEFSMNTKAWEPYALQGKMILLSRGVCVWWTPKNTASYFISRCNQWLLKNTPYRAVTATVDPLANECGTIYQACNWDYLGLMQGNISTSGKEHARTSVIIAGKKHSSRWLRAKIGTMKKAEVLKHYPDAIFVQQYRKRRYITFLGQEGKAIRKTMLHLFVPYDKRGALVELHYRAYAVVYKITNKTNGKVYIGQTLRYIEDRFEEYRRLLGVNPYLSKAIKKYGINNFDFGIIEYCTPTTLNEREKYHILTHGACNRAIGYNIESGGSKSSPSEETVTKMRIAHLGSIQDDTWVQKRVAIAGTPEAKKYGRTKSELERQELSDKTKGENAFWYGKKRSEEFSKAMSERQKGIPMSDSTYKIHLAATGKQVEVIDPSGAVHVFTSQKEAAIFIGVSVNTISGYCLGKFLNKEGYKCRRTNS